ncbi:MAG: lysylphosphatidylglycerol synthase transmembrane domain-containing protein [Actinomycetota bacterium]|nr:lysylphosphatidylglycerol synthase transmembrane domain-containing protein [Actinomycetota bacterium]
MTEPLAETGNDEGGKSRFRSTTISIFGVAVVGLILWFVFTKMVSWSEVADAAGNLSSGDWLLLAGVALARLAVEPLLLVAVTPGLTWSRALGGYLAPAATAAVVPGPSDMAARYAMFRSWGISSAQTSASVVLVLLYTTLARIALPPIAAGVLLVFGRSNAKLSSVAMIAVGVLATVIVVLVLLLRSDQTARRFGHAAGTAATRIARWFHIKAPENLAADLAENLAHFRDTTHNVVRTRTHLASLAALLGQAGLFAILLASVRGVGITSDELDWIAVFAAFALVQILTAIPITPSGLGVAEAAYIALLAAGSSTDLVGEVAAAALIYRVFSWFIVIPLGGIAWVWWTRTQFPARSHASERNAPQSELHGSDPGSDHSG